jgi:hypothetical protein
LGAVGLGLEDAMIHLLNYVWPNVFETSPAHLVNAVHEAIEGLRAALGSCTLLQYTLQGLFHPARKVRNVYWRIYNNMYVTSRSRSLSVRWCLRSQSVATRVCDLNWTFLAVWCVSAVHVGLWVCVSAIWGLGEVGACVAVVAVCAGMWHHKMHWWPRIPRSMMNPNTRIAGMSWSYFCNVCICACTRMADHTYDA